MMHHWDGGWGVGNWLLMGFGMLLFWAVVVAGIVWLVHWMSAGRTAQTVGPSRTTALDILDQRYARGEIGDEEYRTRRETLTTR